jgi:hypothetical protein
VGYYPTLITSRFQAARHIDAAQCLAAFFRDTGTGFARLLAAGTCYNASIGIGADESTR